MSNTTTHVDFQRLDTPCRYSAAADLCFSGEFERWEYHDDPEGWIMGISFTLGAPALPVPAALSRLDTGLSGDEGEPRADHRPHAGKWLEWDLYPQDVFWIRFRAFGWRGFRLSRPRHPLYSERCGSRKVYGRPWFVFEWLATTPWYRADGGSPMGDD